MTVILKKIKKSYFQFMNSAAKNAKMLEETNVYTLISRKDIERLGFIPTGAGKEYVPKYLKKSLLFSILYV